MTFLEEIEAIIRSAYFEIIKKHLSLFDDIVNHVKTW